MNHKKQLTVLAMILSCVNAVMFNSTQAMEENIQATLLSRFQFSAASVLPIYTNTEGQTIAILGQEASGKDKGTYDDFGGAKDPGEIDPEVTAARECMEELILEKTADINLDNVRRYINVNSGNTSYVIARTSKKSVVYITDFSQYWDNIREKFYAAKNKARHYKYREKSHLAVVDWVALQNAITQSQPGQLITIQACGVNKDGSYGTNPITIKLRPFFVAKLRPFFQNQSFQQEDNGKIRLYQ